MGTYVDISKDGLLTFTDDKSIKVFLGRLTDALVDGTIPMYKTIAYYVRNTNRLTAPNPLTKLHNVSINHFEMVNAMKMLMLDEVDGLFTAVVNNQSAYVKKDGIGALWCAPGHVTTSSWRFFNNDEELVLPKPLVKNYPMFNTTFGSIIDIAVVKHHSNLLDYKDTMSIVKSNFTNYRPVRSYYSMSTVFSVYQEVSGSTIQLVNLIGYEIDYEVLANIINRWWSNDRAHI